MPNLLNKMTERVKFLFVDDLKEKLISELALLRRDGLEIFTATSANAALDLLLEKEFSLAIINVQMLGMNGFEFAERMRRNGRTKAIPIIFVTAARNDCERTFKGYESGARTGQSQ